MDLRKIDALVSEHVMGLPLQKDEKRGWVNSRGKYIPHYSSDIVAAWDALEMLRNDGHTIEILGGYGQDTWLVKIDNEFKSHPDAGSAPLAICLAALKAKGIKWEGEPHGSE